MYLWPAGHYIQIYFKNKIYEIYLPTDSILLIKNKQIRLKKPNTMGKIRDLPILKLYSISVSREKKCKQNREPWKDIC